LGIGVPGARADGGVTFPLFRRMRRINPTRLRDDQAGFALIEVLVSAVVLLIVAAGVFTAFGATSRATSFERSRARADALAEQDLERVRSLRIADLTTLNQTRTVIADGTTYTIVSTSQFLQETASTSTCASGNGSRDFLQLRSTVTWQGMGPHSPVTAATVVSPPSGSLVPNSGSLLVVITNAAGNPIPGVILTGSGAGSFTGTTGSTGCVLWHNLPAGTYTMAPGGAAAGMVNEDGNPAPAETVSIVDQGTNTIERSYDVPGSIQNITFRTRAYNNTLVASSADAITVGNSGMQQPKIFTPSAGGRATTFNTTSTLFPFSSADWVYAGSCDSNNPGPGTMLGNANVTPGGGASLLTPGYVQLPSLQVVVWSGTSLIPGSRLAGAKVTADDADAGCTSVRTLTPATGTDSQGQVPQAPPNGGDIGLPYGTYNVCAANSAGTDKRIVSVALTAAGSTGTPVNIYLGGQPAGTCP
jgi:Tfp pilus assembly protein PilV